MSVYCFWHFLKPSSSVSVNLNSPGSDCNLTVCVDLSFTALQSRAKVLHTHTFYQVPAPPSDSTFNRSNWWLRRRWWNQITKKDTLFNCEHLNFSSRWTMKRYHRTLWPEASEPLLTKSISDNLKVTHFPKTGDEEETPPNKMFTEVFMFWVILTALLSLSWCSLFSDVKWVIMFKLDKKEIKYTQRNSPVPVSLSSLSSPLNSMCSYSNPLVVPFVTLWGHQQLRACFHRNDDDDGSLLT